MRPGQVAELRGGSVPFRAAAAVVSRAHDDRAVMAQIGLGPGRLTRDRPSVQRETVRHDAHGWVGPVALAQRVGEHERVSSASAGVARAALLRAA